MSDSPANIDRCPSCEHAQRQPQIVEIIHSGGNGRIVIARTLTVCQKTGELQPYTCPDAPESLSPRQTAMYPDTPRQMAMPGGFNGA